MTAAPGAHPFRQPVVADREERVHRHLTGRITHPHGGGEGKTSGGRHPVTPWGQPTRGYKTRRNKRTDGMIIRRRNKGK